MNKKNLKRLSISMAVLTVTSAYSQVSEYPSRPITAVVNSAAGSSTDTGMRLVAQKLGERLKQAVVVDNKVGASGAIGAEYVAKAAPDGYTLLTTVNTLAIMPAVRNDLPFDVLKDFTYITKLLNVSLTFGLSNNVPAKDLKELFALIRANPGKYTFSSPGVGSPHHLAGELIKQNLKLDIVHVPHKDLALAVQNVVGGHVDMIVSGTGSVLALGNTGKMKLLATSGTKRASYAPNIPTFNELGYSFMDDVDGWTALAGPAKMPPAVVARLSRELREVLALPEVRDGSTKIGVEAVWSSPEQTDAFIRTDVARWQQVVSQGKVKPQ